MSLKIERLLSRANKLYKKGELDKAKEIFLSVLKISPDNKVAKKQLLTLEQNQASNPAKTQLEEAMRLYKSGLLEEAIHAVNELIKNHPNEPILFNVRGACYSSIGPSDNAINDFKKAISLKPDYAEAHYNLGVIFQKIDQNDNAFDCYENALELNHAYPQAHNNI